MRRVHITICICTFRRPDLLRRLLGSIQQQQTDGRFTYSIVIVDNDSRGTARDVVRRFSASSPVPIAYVIEAEQNIAVARNTSIARSQGDYLAFIDDDEEAEKDWLLNLFRTCESRAAAGVLGPVIPRFERPPAHWVIKGKFFERPNHRTGFKIGTGEARTGNLLIRKEILAGNAHPFRARFGSGSEDVDFLGRMMDQGMEFVWCREAVVYEAVPPERANTRYLLRRALVRGGNSIRHEAYRTRLVINSAVALPLYAGMLPFLFVAGRHHFLKYMIKICDHSGRLLALPGYRPSGKRATGGRRQRPALA